MVLSVQVFQALPCDVCVDLCRRKITVSEQELDDPEIRTAIQQVGCECVAQAVW
jgi:hypothetical protein